MKKIGIICASDDELEPFLSHLEKKIVTKKAMLTFYEGTINNINIITLFSGVGKVNAAIASQILIDTYNVDMIINAGTAGGMDETIHLFDTVISTQCAYHDTDDDILTEFHPWIPTIYFDTDIHLIEIAKKLCNINNSIYLGRIVTGDKFIKDEFRDLINQKYVPLSVDMESTSIAHVCHVNKIPFISIRTITDTANHSGTDAFESNCIQASCIAKDVVINFLIELTKTSNL
ncbi:MAG: 5'-methylthioadenosine/adenosylhomocysteine nucleosidase [Coprobacillus sp.]